MADSDEEYERRRRDKFRRERNDYNNERREGGDRRNGPWEDRNRENWGGRGGRSREDRREGYQNRDFDRNRRDRFSPTRHDMSPPQMKRMRRDWDDNGFGGGHFEGGFSGPGGGGGGHHGGFGHSGGDHFGGRGDEIPTQPAMSTFKQFLVQQDDNISDEEAIRKYNEYKLEFRKTQINEFFLSHKEEEWFKSKYHPEECGRRKEESRNALKHRADIFFKIIDMGYMKDVTCDVEKSDEIIKMLDAAVILMEDGTDFDLRVLDVPVIPPQEETQRKRTESSGPEEPKPQGEEPAAEKEETEEQKNGAEEGEMEDEETEEEKKPDGPLNMPIEGEQEDLVRQAEEFKKQKEETEGDEQKEKDESAEPNTDEAEAKKPKKRKREYSFESGSESSNSMSDNESDTEPAPPGVEAGAEGAPAEGEEQQKPADDSKEEEGEDNSKAEKEAGEEEEEEKERESREQQEEDEPRPRALHRTMSIFLRNLAPSITRQEVEAMCKRYPGFMRVAIQDPQPERRFFRRGWVTFDRTVNIKDICWNLNNIRLRDCEMGAIVNRELKQRVRPVNGLTMHKTIIRQDIKHAAKIIQNLDSKHKLWEDEGEEKKDKEKEPQSFGLVSKNPVLKNITNYLVEEGSYEEEELLGVSLEEKPKEANPEVTIEREPEFQTVLDRLILYLRLVHSFDFYSSVEYPNEDEMPHRCGIIHARGPLPPNRVKQNDLNDWIQTFETKLMPFLTLEDQLDEEKTKKIGRKDSEEEVEKFIQANTQELSKDKWLCPLSGKKFKGPDFIRKHIFNKHGEKVDEVRMEVAYFNNYLMDPKRPQLPEHPGNRPSGPPPSRSDNYNQGGGGGGYQSGMRGFNSGPAPPWNQGGPGHFGSNFQSRGDGNRYEPRRERYDRFPARRDRGRPDPRSIIEYRDLDAPDDFDIFS